MSADLAALTDYERWLDYMDGRSDCAKGVELNGNRSRAYQRGYAAEYAESEAITARRIEEEAWTLLH